MQIPSAHIIRVDIIPDIDAGRVNVTVLGSQAAEGAVAHIIVLDKKGDKVTILHT